MFVFRTSLRLEARVTGFLRFNICNSEAWGTPMCGILTLRTTDLVLALGSASEAMPRKLASSSIGERLVFHLPHPVWILASGYDDVGMILLFEELKIFCDI
ncbi:uncharacterized protein [Glycine max]|uniref:uncharacterized protein isoform X1 n=1 Tax=Glycine max TaxID=3847 RepID=UPI00029550F8|nr:uncharacterized protein LOC100775561 isoform X1 [Glycine max]|eukprot:XP_025984973.1 uncharacterized protein LOC100775561 isoform X1 [Glycine max]